jgi:alanine dehydrogenase
MRIGIPSETKTLEGRVALVPAAAADLARRGHEVFIQSGAGTKSGFSDADYAAVGITVVPDAAALYEAGELIVKVKEPVKGDLELLKKHHLLFCYLHLAAEPELTKRLLEIGLTGVAFESVEENGGLPLLLPMSVIAGRIATQIGTTLLHQPNGGKGKLLGGMPSTPRGKVVVLGAGAAGGNAAALAAAAGANVVVFDKRADRMAEMMALGPNVTALYA